MKISVIIPVYNLEAYVTDCVDSVLDQTYPDLEIILVDDGSTDGSLALLEDFDAQDPRVRVLSQSNQGLGMARNNAMDIATGDRVFFLDADDHIKPHTIERLVQVTEADDADIAVASRVLDYESGAPSTVQHYPLVSDPDTWVRLLLTWQVGFSAWGKLYDAQLFRDHHIRYTATRMEDLLPAVQLFMSARLISVVQEPLYHYRQRCNSGSRVSATSHIVDKREVLDRIREYLESTGNMPRYRHEYLAAYLIHVIARNYTMLERGDFDESFRTAEKQRIHNDPIFQRQYIRYVPQRRWRSRLMAIRFAPRLFRFFARIKR